jgi:putative ABC transport system permease protein
MRKTRLGRALGALLPGPVRADLFEPALQDLYVESAWNGRGTSLATIGLFLECWRLAPAEVFAMFAHDVRHALRLLVREPGFTMAAVLTLALGVGANAAVFAVVNAALLRPLPYPDADRLLLLQHRDRRTGITKEFIAAGDFADLRARQRSFESLAGFGFGPSTVYTADEPFAVNVLQATPDLLDLLRAGTALGRALTAGDAGEGAAPVVVLGNQIWRERFGADPTIVGRSIKLGPRLRQVVGVAAEGFRFPANARTDAIVPLRLPASAPAQRKSDWTFAIGRLAPGTTMARALDDLTTISRQMEREHPDQNEGSEYVALRVHDAMVGDTKRALILLLAAVSLVLLIACVNVANLLVARAVGRRQETAVRVALGAGRPRLAAQWITESLVLGIAAGVVGIAIAHWAIPVLVRMAPAAGNLPAASTIGVDRLVLAFTAGLTLLTTIVFGVVPALGIRIDNAAGALVNPGRVTAGGAARRASSALVVVETALAIVLLTGAGLVLRSFARLLAVDPGFRTARVLTLDIELPAERYRAEPARTAFYARALDALRHLKGVEAAGAAVVMPLTGNNWTVPFDRADRPVPAGQRPPDVGWQAATGGYFSTLQIPLRAGRLFDATDRPGGPQVVIVSEAVRERFFPGENPIGRRVRTGDGIAEIVGVVGDIRRAALTDRPRADMYFPMEQAPQAQTTLVIRTAGDPLQAVGAVRTALRAIEPQIVLRDIQTLEAIARESVQLTRLALSLLGVFAVAALALASVGIYGVMAHSVRQRTREIGTRVALGATASNILWLVIREGIVVAGLGVVLGLAANVAAARALSTLLYGTSPADPLTLAVATLVLLAVALLACYLPARRATRVDPVKTLAAQ